MGGWESNPPAAALLALSSSRGLLAFSAGSAAQPLRWWTWPESNRLTRGTYLALAGTIIPLTCSGSDDLSPWTSESNTPVRRSRSESNRRSLGCSQPPFLLATRPNGVGRDRRVSPFTIPSILGKPSGSRRGSRTHGRPVNSRLPYHLAILEYFFESRRQESNP